MNRILKGEFLFTAMMFLFIGSVLMGCQQDDDLPETKSTTDEVETSKEQQNESELTSEIESLQAQMTDLHAQKQYLVTVIKEMIADFTEEEMLEFSQDQIIYNLTVNGDSVPKNGELTIPNGDVKIILSERIMGYDVLPPEWVERGRISENYIDQIVNFDTSKWTPMATDGTVVTGQGYETAQMKAGEQFSFNISDDLKKRLKLDTNTIQITVN